jgi:hypothetical protein
MWPKIRTHAVTAILFLALGFALGRGCTPDVITKSVTRWERDTVSIHDTVSLARFERSVVPYIGGQKLISEPDPARPCGSFKIETFVPWHSGLFSGADTLSFLMDCDAGAVRNLVLGRSPLPVIERTKYISKVTGSAEVVTLEANPDLFQVWASAQYDVLPLLLPAPRSFAVSVDAGLFFRNVQFTVGPAVSESGLRLNLSAKTRLF